MREDWVADSAIGAAFPLYLMPPSPAHSSIIRQSGRFVSGKIDCLSSGLSDEHSSTHLARLHAGWFASRRRVPTEAAVALLSFSSDDRGRVCGRACQHRDAADAVAVATVTFNHPVSSLLEDVAVNSVPT